MVLSQPFLSHFYIQALSPNHCTSNIFSTCPPHAIYELQTSVLGAFLNPGPIRSLASSPPPTGIRSKACTLAWQSESCRTWPHTLRILLSHSGHLFLVPSYDALILCPHHTTPVPTLHLCPDYSLHLDYLPDLSTTSKSSYSFK